MLVKVQYDLQTDVIGIHSNLTRKHLTFNSSKYIIASRERKKKNIPAAVLDFAFGVAPWGGEGLQVSRSECYLHCSGQTIVRSAWKQGEVGMLYRKFYSWADSNTLWTLYLTVHKASPRICLWVMGSDPHLKRDIDRLENVQLACKMCLLCTSADNTRLEDNTSTHLTYSSRQLSQMVG